AGEEAKALMELSPRGKRNPIPSHFHSERTRPVKIRKNPSLFNPKSKIENPKCFQSAIGNRQFLGDSQLLLHFLQGDPLGLRIQEEDHKELKPRHDGEEHERVA